MLHTDALFHFSICTQLGMSSIYFNPLSTFACSLSLMIEGQI